MKSVNIAFSKNAYKFLHEMIGKNFAKIACNKFVYSNSVYGIVGIYVGELIYKVTNFVDAIDYYGKLEDVAVFKLEEASENEIIALAQGAKKIMKIVEAQEATVLDLGSRDAKWIKFRKGKFHDMDWNTSCASSTGATVEMLLKFYNLKPEDLEFNSEKFAVTCGIFGLYWFVNVFFTSSFFIFLISLFL